MSLWLQLRSDPRAMPRVHYWAYMRVIERIRHNRVTDDQWPMRRLNGATANNAMRHINA